jgi:hypothetical protein
MGVVYKAEDITLHRFVALKVGTKITRPKGHRRTRLKTNAADCRESSIRCGSQHWLDFPALLACSLEIEQVEHISDCRRV